MAGTARSDNTDTYADDVDTLHAINGVWGTGWNDLAATANFNFSNAAHKNHTETITSKWSWSESALVSFEGNVSTWLTFDNSGVGADNAVIAILTDSADQYEAGLEITDPIIGEEYHFFGTCHYSNVTMVRHRDPTADDTVALVMESNTYQGTVGIVSKGPASAPKFVFGAASSYPDSINPASNPYLDNGRVTDLTDGGTTTLHSHGADHRNVHTPIWQPSHPTKDKEWMLSIPSFLQPAETDEVEPLKVKGIKFVMDDPINLKTISMIGVYDKGEVPLVVKNSGSFKEGLNEFEFNPVDCSSYMYILIRIETEGFVPDLVKMTHPLCNIFYEEAAYWKEQRNKQTLINQ
jgi:hypothetical protein